MEPPNEHPNFVFRLKFYNLYKKKVDLKRNHLSFNIAIRILQSKIFYLFNFIFKPMGVHSIVAGSEK